MSISVTFATLRQWAIDQGHAIGEVVHNFIDKIEGKATAIADAQKVLTDAGWTVTPPPTAG